MDPGPAETRIERQDEQYRSPRLQALRPITVDTFWHLRPRSESSYRWTGLWDPSGNRLEIKRLWRRG